MKSSKRLSETLSNDSFEVKRGEDSVRPAVDDDGDRGAAKRLNMVGRCGNGLRVVRAGTFFPVALEFGTGLLVTTESRKHVGIAVKTRELLRVIMLYALRSNVVIPLDRPSNYKDSQARVSRR